MAQASSRKEETRDRILRTAARAIRTRGFQGVGVAEIMQEAGLTHGGFYAHFASKTELLAEAADRAGADGMERLSRAARARVDSDQNTGRASVSEDPAHTAHTALMALVDAYLSEEHLLAPGLGCPMAALGSEMPRQPHEVRRAATRRIEDMVGMVERQMPEWGQSGARDRAMALLSCLVGTMVLARAVDRPAMADALRQASRHFLAERLAPEPLHR